MDKVCTIFNKSSRVQITSIVKQMRHKHWGSSKQHLILLFSVWLVEVLAPALNDFVFLEMTPRTCQLIKAPAAKTLQSALAPHMKISLAVSICVF